MVFNGRGQAFDADVQSARKNAVHVRLGLARDAAPEARVAITLVQAVLKGDKMDDVVRDAVMIGVAAIQPVVTERSEVTLASLVRGKRHERWQRVAVSSAKQCGRAVVPPILDAQLFGAIGPLTDERQLPGPCLTLVEPGASGDAVSIADLDEIPPREVSLVIGPEGGWTPAEIATASGWSRLVTAGGRTIRADAMGLVAAAALFTQWREY